MNQLKNIAKLRFIRQFHTTTIKFTTKVSEPTTKETSTEQEQELVPSEPVASKLDLNLLPPRTKVDVEVIALLERLALCNFGNREGIEVLEDSIQFADQILQVDTEGIEPLVTVLEDRPLEIREDEVSDGNRREEVLANATVTEDEYLVAPPGNIPLETRENLSYEEDTEEKKEK